ncbi:hypothetical protein GH714_018298 [Hevea brasiliensis]|uniref:Syntaxin N-terminal domain-containing protein n=1 Tax=Hevea brasiliensis TaxID=3981 RepID=A0A6A6LTR7_HEVBR|nr:hypothetical protein GH714_018298 [Hevea brasiliensis]
MNDLFSNSFKKYTDLKQQAYLDDIEAGRENTSLDKFFDDVENVKEDMKSVEKLHKSLQDANEESKTVHNAKTMKNLRSRMDSDVEQVLKRVKIIKGKLEALERSNAAARNVPGCGPGSSADRTRISVVSGLGKKLKDLMDNFQNFRAQMNAEYRKPWSAATMAAEVVAGQLQQLDVPLWQAPQRSPKRFMAAGQSIL